MQKSFSRAYRLEAITIDRRKIASILSRVEFSENGCWNWQGWLDRGGYGYVCYKNRDINIHRFFYAWCCGAIPKGKIVRHTCNNRKCVNPEHLILGTMWDNSQDMINSGNSLTGERNPNSALTEKAILEMAELYKTGCVSLKDISEEYKVSPGVVQAALSGSTWKYLNLNIDYKDIVNNKLKNRTKVALENTPIMWQMWKDGKGWRDIGKEFGISDNAVKKRILKYDLQLSASQIIMTTDQT